MQQEVVEEVVFIGKTKKGRKKGTRRVRRKIQVHEINILGVTKWDIMLASV